MNWDFLCIGISYHKAVQFTAEIAEVITATEFNQLKRDLISDDATFSWEVIDYLFLVYNKCNL
jgi:hypothetical protein